MTAPRIVVIVPCRDEVATIGRVVADFRAALPDARVVVFDNNSRDGTGERAERAGAELRGEPRQGKGHVLRRAFADLDADIYVLVDGDDTYDAAAAPAMIDMLRRRTLDMVTGVREGGGAAYPPGHRLGNRALTAAVRWIFGSGASDMLSGYRVFSRRFVKSFPAMAAGFETETEFTVHALELRLPTGEFPTAYRGRGHGSRSKLRTWRDGLRIAGTILSLVKEGRPLAFFALIAAALLALGLALGLPVVGEFFDTGRVPRLPTAVLATGLVLLACLSLCCGLVLDSVSRGRREAKRLAYLAQPGPS